MIARYNGTDRLRIVETNSDEYLSNKFRSYRRNYARKMYGFTMINGTTSGAALRGGILL